MLVNEGPTEAHQQAAVEGYRLMSVYKHGRVYWFDFIIKGCRWRRNTRTTVKREAQKMEKRYRKSLKRALEVWVTGL